MRALVLALVLAGGVCAQEYDLVVYGGSSAGVSAAVQAARMQRSVLLIAPSGRLGGLSSSGLGMTDTGDKTAIGGLAREFYARLHAHYATDEAWRQERAGDYRWFDEAADALWRFEPAEPRLAHVLDLPSRGDTCFPAVLPGRQPGEWIVYDYSSPLEGDDLRWIQGQRGETRIYRHLLAFQKQKGASTNGPRPSGKQ